MKTSKLELVNCEISQLKQDKRRPISENTLIIIRNALYLNNYLDCDYIFSCIGDLEKTTRLKELKENINILKRAIQAKFDYDVNNKNPNKLDNFYLNITVASIHILGKHIYKDDLFVA